MKSQLCPILGFDPIQIAIISFAQVIKNDLSKKY